jgi:signal transduction histidine kinase
VGRLGLQNVLVNLAINARDAMPDGGVLSISALFADGPEAPEVEIIVTDTGTGMEEDVLARALEPRFSTKPTGSGMGLAGARQFIEAAGGRIAISSTPGRGTAVTLRLPAVV